jgi:NAD(P)-dependent dehydrogenase (short-subunit alcohol dehydrogenase family)
VATDLDAQAAKETATLIEQAGGSATPMQLDVTDSTSVREAVAATVERFGDRFDGLVNNAGTDRGAGLLDLTDEHWHSVIAVNQSGPLFTTRAPRRPPTTPPRRHLPC